MQVLCLTTINKISKCVFNEAIRNISLIYYKPHLLFIGLLFDSYLRV